MSPSLEMQNKKIDFFTIQWKLLCRHKITLSLLGRGNNEISSSTMQSSDVLVLEIIVQMRDLKCPRNCVTITEYVKWSITFGKHNKRHMDTS